MKLLELFEKEPTNEAFGGMASALARKAKAALTPTKVGAGARQMENDTKLQMDRWEKYKGETGVPANGPAIHKWISKVAGLDDDRIWDAAIKDYKKNFPAAAKKYLNDESLDRYEVLNLFYTLKKIRKQNPDVKLWTKAPKGKPEDQAEKDKIKPQFVDKKPKKKSEFADVGELNIPHTTNNKTDDSPEVHQEWDNMIPMPPSSAQPMIGKSSTVRPAYFRNKNSSIPPQPTPPAAPSTTAPGNAGNIDWEAIRKRFPDNKIKPRVSIPMGSKKVD